MSVQSRTAESQQIAEQTAPGVSGAPHTPTPWSINLDQHECLIVSGVKSPDGDGPCLVSDMYRGGYDYEEFGFTARANAAFIVRAVNSHDALVKALEEMIEVYWGDGDGELPEPHCIQNARAALASAREVQS